MSYAIFKKNYAYFLLLNLKIDLIGFMSNVLVFYCYTKGENSFFFKN
jgi:hypothetical protein